MANANTRRLSSTALRWLMSFALCGLLVTHAWAMETILSEDGTLPSTLQLRETQSGFAGETTTIVVVRPDGRFCRWHELNGAPMGEAKSGRLDAGQLADLAGTLARHDVANLPDHYSDAPPVNARQLVLSFSGRQMVFELPPADPIRQPSSGADAMAPSARIGAIRQALIDAIENAPPAPVDDCPSPE